MLVETCAVDEFIKARQTPRMKIWISVWFITKSCVWALFGAAGLTVQTLLHGQVWFRFPRSKRTGFQKLEASSRENRTPPIGAPKAAASPDAAPLERKSRRSWSLWNKSNIFPWLLHHHNTPGEAHSPASSCKIAQFSQYKMFMACKTSMFSQYLRIQFNCVPCILMHLNNNATTGNTYGMYIMTAPGHAAIENTISIIP